MVKDGEGEARVASIDLDGMTLLEYRLALASITALALLLIGVILFVLAGAGQEIHHG